MRIFIAAAFLITAHSVNASNLNCSGPNNWAATSAFIKLKNAGLATNSSIDLNKTKVSLLVQNKLGKNLYQQVHRIDFFSDSGKSITVITSNKASTEECSMSNVDVYVVSQKLKD